MLRTGADALKASQVRLVAHFAQNRSLYAAVGALPVSKQSYLADVRAMAAVIERELAEHLLGLLPSWFSRTR